MKAISICNRKGGVGKTTTTINLGTALAKLGKNVLLIDCDPQGNLSETMGYIPDNQPTTANELIYFASNNIPCEYASFIRKNESEGVDYIPAAASLDAAPTLLALAKDASQILARALRDDFFRKYDVILMDCKPSLDLLTVNSLAASDGVIIPVEPEEYALKGLADLLHTIQATREQLNPSLEITGVLLTRADSRRASVQEVRKELMDVFGDKVFSVTIPMLIEASNAAKEKRSCVIDEKSKIGQLYISAAEEVLERWT